MNKSLIIVLIISLLLSGCERQSNTEITHTELNTEVNLSELDNNINIEQSNTNEEVVEPNLYTIYCEFDEYVDSYLIGHDKENATKTYKIEVDSEYEYIMSFFKKGDFVELQVDLNSSKLHNIKIKNLKDTSKLVVINNDSAIVEEENNISIQIGEEIVVYDVKPQIINDYLMIPVRFTAEPLGFIVRWHNEGQSVDVVKEDMFIRFTLNKNEYFYNNNDPIKLTRAPVSYEGRTLVPIDFFTVFLTEIIERHNRPY